MTYSAPVLDMLFVLRAVIGDDALKSLKRDDLAELLEPVLQEAGNLAEGVLAPLNHSGDKETAKWNDGDVKTAKGWKEAYAAYRQGGWNGVPFSTDFGGQGLPWVLAFPVQEMWQAANMAFGLCPLLNQGAVEAIYHHGTDEQKQTYLPKLVSGEWTGTMNLTEPQAGSDLAAITAKAERAGSGYKVFGQKIFITYGEHDLADNIIHLVLARLPDAPAGVKGISLFIVPKFLADGSRNDVKCVSVEHKLGIHASPTCTMQFGDKGGATAFLVGKEHEGIKYMFTMMNNARLSVGLQGVAIAERATQKAMAYAADRVQGGKPIIEHADVKRMLLTMQAYTQAGRMLAYEAAFAMDSGDKPKVELLTPIVKAWCTDRSVDVASLGVQIHGGMGFIEETGAAQYYRDARILPIYEGTNGIQAADLVHRKILKDGGAAMKNWMDGQKELLHELDTSHGGDMSMISETVHEAFDSLKGATGSILAMGKNEDLESVSAVSHAYISLAGNVMAGMALAKAALRARNMLRDGNTTDFSPEFLKKKIMLARFFGDHILPHTSGLARTVRVGGASVLQGSL
ncbi:MAG: acyl-CoA dehydrogenase C-terminal domain-containing protein [Alphaproteobacteria bacterium]|nr:acyl-CoA dehydrogenase C-terminal domain-containing protein [Alphaproteobacteria bacterium]